MLLGMRGLWQHGTRPDKRLLFDRSPAFAFSNGVCLPLPTPASLRPSFAHGRVHVSTVDCSFINNGAADLEYGGALAVSGTVTVMLDGCIFANNTAKTGAAVWSQVGSKDNGALAITQCTFTGNRGQVRHPPYRYLCPLLAACNACHHLGIPGPCD